MTNPFIETSDRPLNLGSQRGVVTGASVSVIKPYTEQGVKDVARQQAEEALKSMKTVPQMIWEAIVGLIKVVVHAITHPISTVVGFVKDVFGWLFGSDSGGREQELADQLTAQEQARQEQNALTYNGFNDRLTALEQAPKPPSYDWVSSDQLIVQQRRGQVVTASGRVVIPTGGTFVDVPLQAWAIPTAFAFLQLPAGFSGVSSRGPLRTADKVIRLWGTEGQTVAFSVSWCV